MKRSHQVLVKFEKCEGDSHTSSVLEMQESISCDRLAVYRGFDKEIPNMITHREVFSIASVVFDTSRIVALFRTKMRIT